MNFTKKPLYIRLGVLFIGLVLYAVGIAFSVKADIGLSPWDVFHYGISNITGITFGRVSILVGMAILAFNYFRREKIGAGTVFNVFLIGAIIDFIFAKDFIKTPEAYPVKVVFMLIGMMTIAFATAFYISAGLGAGPRDGLMVVLTKLSKKDIALVRNGIELTVTVLGFLLGGKIGLGTLMTVFLMGYFIKFAFKVTKFDIQNIKHDYLDKELLEKIKKSFKLQES